uniref:Ion transport domain-containing protein n=1 Tax=Arcella intermedia TaxID=1963864 RepID=A0A6B2L461_9EUKA
MVVSQLLKATSISYKPSKEDFDEFEEISSEEEVEMKGKLVSMRDVLIEIANTPTWSWVSVVYSCINFLAIMASTIGFIISTMANVDTSWTGTVEDVTICIFTFDYLWRLGLTRTHRIKYVFKTMNLIDFFAIIPYFMELVFDKAATNLRVLVVLRTLRLFRVFRFLKIAKYSRDIPIITKALSRSQSGFFLSIFTLCLFCILWASAEYYAEQTQCFYDPDDQLWKYNEAYGGGVSPFQSIPHTMWFVIVTMTTCGYGDQFPITPLGKLVAGLAMVCGVFVISIPITILASNFSLEYNKETINEERVRAYYSKKKERRADPPKHKQPEQRVEELAKNLQAFRDHVDNAQVTVQHFESIYDQMEEQVRLLSRLYRRRKQLDREYGKFN